MIHETGEFFDNFRYKLALTPDDGRPAEMTATLRERLETSPGSTSIAQFNSSGGMVVHEMLQRGRFFIGQRDKVVEPKHKVERFLGILKIKGFHPILNL